MKLFGLTGGIGMGKSAAAHILFQRGVMIEDTDELARNIVAPSQPALAEIQRAFGDEVISPEGTLRRDILARIVFSDPTARQKLEAITHPVIRNLWKKQVETWRTMKFHKAACVVIPLLFEINAESEFDATICVACSPATQRSRLAIRGWGSEQTTQRIAAQMPIDKKIAKSDYVMWNEGSLKILAAQLKVVCGQFYIWPERQPELGGTSAAGDKPGRVSF
jgi:dephospho-CoA kinase